MKQILLLLLLPALLSAQKYNYQWPYGYGSNFNLDFGFSLLDFNSSTVSIAPTVEQDGFEFGNNGSFICNKDGQLQLMTNNCSIRDKDFNIISGGDTLTPGETWDNYCTGLWGGYPSHQASLFLPELTNDSVFYLLHKDANFSDVNQDIITEHFYLSVIVHKTDNSYYLKSRSLIKSGPMLLGKLTACANKTRTKWWTFTADYNSNKLYCFEIGSNGIVSPPVITTIGLPLLGAQVQISQSAFSPDTKTLAINNCRDLGVFLYDFDNETGVLSNFRHKPYQNTWFTGDGTCFSPNSQYLFLTSNTNIYQMDIKNINAPDAVVFIDSVDLRDETNWPINIGNMYPGPDCRIYAGPASTTYYIHVIHEPNQKGLACKFEVNAIRSPTNLEHDLPNTINYMPDGACDSTIGWGIVPVRDVNPSTNASIKVFPNPVHQLLYLEGSLAHDGYFTLFDPSGKIVLQTKAANGRADVSALRNGIYFYELPDENGNPHHGKIMVKNE